MSSTFPPRPRALPPPPPPLPAPAPNGRKVVVTAVALVTVLVIAVAAVAPSVSRPRQLSETTGRDYAFILNTASGTPFRWNPCAPIHYVENLDGAPAGAADDVSGALERVSAATGISFVDDGTTTELPVLHRAAFQPARYGERWAPVLVAWVTPSQTDIPFEREGHTASGVASPQLPDDQTGEVYVSGWVAINASDPSAAGFDTYGDQGLVLQHELSHVMGLAHVNRWGELMQPSGGGVTDYGPGDLAGLRLLGRSQGCLTTPPIPG